MCRLLVTELKSIEGKFFSSLSLLIATTLLCVTEQIPLTLWCSIISKTFYVSPPQINFPMMLAKKSKTIQGVQIKLKSLSKIFPLWLEFWIWRIWVGFFCFCFFLRRRRNRAGGAGWEISILLQITTGFVFQNCREPKQFIKAQNISKVYIHFRNFVPSLSLSGERQNGVVPPWLWQWSVSDLISLIFISLM